MKATCFITGSWLSAKLDKGRNLLPAEGLCVLQELLHVQQEVLQILAGCEPLDRALL